MADLSLVDIDEIMAELAKRYDGVVLSCVRSRSKDTDERYLNWRGGNITAIGLCRYAELKIMTFTPDTGQET